MADVADTANKKVIQPTGDYLARVPGAVNDTVVSPTIVYGKRIPGAAKEVVIDPALEIHQAAVTEVSNGAFAVTHEFPAAVKQAAKDAVV